MRWLWKIMWECFIWCFTWVSVFQSYLFELHGENAMHNFIEKHLEWDVECLGNYCLKTIETFGFRRYKTETVIILTRHTWIRILWIVIFFWKAAPNILYTQKRIQTNQQKKTRKSIVSCWTADCYGNIKLVQQTALVPSHFQEINDPKSMQLWNDNGKSTANITESNRSSGEKLQSSIMTSRMTIDINTWAWDGCLLFHMTNYYWIACSCFSVCSLCAFV